MNSAERKLYSCCFFGHRKIVVTNELISSLTNTIENLIANENIKIFLFGSKSQFNDLCYMVVTSLKEKHPHIKRVYVRAEFLYIDESYKDYLLSRFEDTYYPRKIINAGKAAYIERNYEMIDKSNFCVVYYDENLSNCLYKGNSGTQLAYSYAVRKGKRIINIVG